MNGVLIIALGYDLYGKCAYNLALSLKAYDDSIRVCILYEPSAISKLSQKELEFFDDHILIDPKDYTVNGKPQYQRAKLCAYKYSPYDFTMYLDADNIWLPEKKPSWLMGEFINNLFTIGMHGQYDVETGRNAKEGYMFWGEPRQIANYHGIKKTLPQSVSGFFCFKKDERIKQLFDLALVIYDDPNAPSVIWAQGKPDEYCFNVAMGLLGMSQKQLSVLHFDKIDGVLEPENIYRGFWGIAMGTHKVSPNLITLYNKLVNKYSIMAGMDSRHYHVDKRDVIPERKRF